MSSSRRRRNKWLRTPQLGWVYYNPYHDLYVLCVRLIKSKDDFMGKVLLSKDLVKYPQGTEILCGTLLSTYNDDNEIYTKYRSKRYKDSYSRRCGGTAFRNIAILDVQNRNTFYKMYEL